MDAMQIVELLREHENRSQHRYESLKAEVGKMGEGINTDKVIVNAGSGGGDSGSVAAIIAALGNRNQGNDNAALIAALGNRNDDSANWAPMMAMMGGGGGFGGGNMNNIWPIILLALLGRGGRGGLFGGGDDCGGGGDAINQLTLNEVLAKLGTLEGQVPLTASQTQNVVQNAIAQLALADQQGFSGVKDSVQNLALALSQGIAGVNQNVSAQGCATRERVDTDGDKTRALLVARFSQEDATKIAEQNSRIQALESARENDRRYAETNLTISNNNTAIAAQSQGQQQAQQQQQLMLLQSLVPTVNALIGDIQAVKQGQVIFNSGTMAASGTQAAANTKVA